MNKEELLQYLKENLKIEITKKPYSCYLHVKLLLEGEVISEVNEDITIQD